MSNQTSTMRSQLDVAQPTSHYGLLPSPLSTVAASSSSNYQYQHSADISIHPRYLPESSSWVPDNYSSNEQDYYTPLQIMHYPQVIQTSHMQNQAYYTPQPQLEQEIIHTNQVWSIDQAIPETEPVSQSSTLLEAPDKSVEEPEDLLDYGSRKPFISKLGYLLRNPELYNDVIQWDETGSVFILAPSKRFVEEVLPEIYSHSSVSAFTRQLNTYAFRHLTAVQLADTFSHSPDTFTPIRELSAWHHPLFSRDAPHESNRMVPTPSRARAAGAKLKHEMLSQRGTAASGRTSSLVADKATKVSKQTKTPKTPKLKKASVAGEMVEFLQV